jgi:hypothetical protein
LRYRLNSNSLFIWKCRRDHLNRCWFQLNGEQAPAKDRGILFSAGPADHRQKRIIN